MVLNKYYGDTGVDQLDTGGNPIFTFLSSVLNDGEVLADDGRAYTDIQSAVDNATGFVLVSPGTFQENVTVSTADLSLVGSGFNTLVDGENNTGIDVQSTGVQIRNLKANNDAAATTDPSYGIEFNAADGLIANCYSTEALTGCFRVNNSDSMIMNTIGDVSDTAESTTITAGPRCIVSNHISKDANSNAASFFGDDGIGTNCIVQGADGAGIRIAANDNTIHGCRGISNGGGSGNPRENIRVSSGSNNLIAKNRLSDGNNGDIEDQGTGTTLDDNETGTAN